MTHAYTKQALANIAAGLADDEVLLCDMWDRENFNEAHEVDLTASQWVQFIEFYSEYNGLESLQDEIDTFIQRHGNDEQRAPEC